VKVLRVKLWGLKSIPWYPIHVAVQHYLCKQYQTLRMSLNYDDEFLNMPEYGSPTNRALENMSTLETIPGMPTDSSITGESKPAAERERLELTPKSAVTTSPLDFTGQLDTFLDAEDRSTLTEEIPQLTPWTSPRLPKAGRKAGAQSFLQEVLSLADAQRARQKRVRVSTAQNFSMLLGY
jgi:hypothetical protein